MSSLATDNPESRTALLQLRQAGQDYGYQKVLRDLDMDIIAGQFLCLQGPNGAGKSTLLKCLTARRGPDHGQLFYKENLVNNLEDFNNYLGEIAYLGHATGLMLDLSAAENLHYIAGLNFKRGVHDLPQSLSIDDWLRRVGLIARRDDAVRTYSRGMQQRLALARVFMLQPELLYLDEPLTGLDREGIALLQSLLGDYKKLGGTAIYVTHDESAFQQITDRYVFFNKGRLVADLLTDKYNDQARKHVHNMLYKDES